MAQLVKAGPFELLCDDPFEVARAQSYLTKEPGTIEWLEGIQPGETVYDIGANIGLYTLAAALHVGPEGMVYAFEPHVANAASLLRNVQCNGMGDRVRVLTCAVGSHEGLWPFHYASKRAGSSGSQLGSPVDEHGKTFAPAATELKWVTTLDWLVNDGQVQHPNRVKIDVDGQEPAILRGAHALLRSGTVRSLQVEVHGQTRETLRTELRRAGYALQRIHYTANGQAAIAKGADPLLLAHNEVFSRAA